MFASRYRIKFKINTLFELLHQWLITSITYGIQGLNITPKEMPAIENIKYTILRRILNVPVSTTKIALLADAGTLPLEIKSKSAFM